MRVCYMPNNQVSDYVEVRKSRGGIALGAGNLKIMGLPIWEFPTSATAKLIASSLGVGNHAARGPERLECQPG
jgi:hypothetical protein